MGILSVVLTVALLVPSLQLPLTLEATPRAQPVLLQQAVANPQSRVQVIVQKWAKDQSLEQLVAKLGGTVTLDLHIINAFAAELPASAVSKLATARGVRWVSLDAVLGDSAGPVDDRSQIDSPISTTNLRSVYTRAIGATQLWSETPSMQGQGIGVAVVDSGVTKHDDLRQTTDSKSGFRISAWQSYYQRCAANQCLYDGAVDMFGHGTHVAGIIGGNGARSYGAYVGVAPRVNIIGVKVSDDNGAGRTSTVVAGLQWVYENRNRYNIRVVNLSLNGSIPESYNTSPLDAALEILWFNRIVVVVSAGNSGSASLYPPANDPFVITVGAIDDRGTVEPNDDILARFSAYGTIGQGLTKPDLVAPGTNIISLLASGSSLAQKHPDHSVSGFFGSNQYFRMSGTSMASAVVAGAVALLLQEEPTLTPDQVKYRLMATARPIPGNGAGAGALNIYAAVRASTAASANSGLVPSRLLWSGVNPIHWNNTNWNSVNWDSVNWDSVNWDSVNWDSVNWDSVYWGD